MHIIRASRQLLKWKCIVSAELLTWQVIVFHTARPSSSCSVLRLSSSCSVLRPSSSCSVLRSAVDNLIMRQIYGLIFSSSSSCSWRVRRVSCSLILKMKLVPPSLPRSSYVTSSFGLYCSACFGSLFVSIVCTCCSHFWFIL